MRNDFVKQCIMEMQKNENIVFLTADLGFNALEPIKREFPDRFYNVGIAEANMIGIACGLAHEGKKVICYSIASFAALRAYEQIRVDVCYDNLDVKIIGTGGGFNYAAHGVTHHTFEDIAALSALPNMMVANPAHSFEAKEVTRTMLQSKSPCYVRFGKKPKETFLCPRSIEIGDSCSVKEGDEIAILSSGNLLERAFALANILETKLKRKVGVISIPWLKPLNTTSLWEKIKNASGIFTIEEHNVIGGLGSLAAKFLMEKIEKKIIFEAFGIQDVFHKEVGSRDYLLDLAGLAPTDLAKKIEERFAQEKSYCTNQ